MNDAYPFLENRTDLEKLEQDLALLTSPAAGTLAAGIQQRIQTARRDLETARAAHIALIYQLSHIDGGMRVEARQQLLKRIKTGEVKIFDPHSGTWRNAADVLLEASQHEDDYSRNETQAHQLVAALQSASDTPHSLKDLAQLIGKAEELERQQNLPAEGQAALRQAYLTLESGQKKHRELTLKLRSGNLAEKAGVVEEIRRLIADGESEILEAPAQMWRPADQVLNEAIRIYQQELARLVDQILRKDIELNKTHQELALKTLYQALDKAIPYTEDDRRRLEKVYLERHGERRKPAAPPLPLEAEMTQEDREGYRKVHEATRLRLNTMFIRSVDWLNQFFRSTLTRNVRNLLDQAESKDMPLAKTVELINMADALARKQMEGSLEIPEVLVCGSRILTKKNEIKLARELLEKALPLYTLDRPDKIHRHAVAAWLLGCLDYSLGSHFNGYSQWKLSRGLFNDMLVEARRIRHVEKTAWYKARLLEIDTASIQTFETVYFGWLNEFGMQNSPHWMAEYRKLMDTQYAQNKIAELRQTIKLVLRDTEREKGPEEYWEALVEAAFFEYQIPDFKAAIAHLDQAKTGYRFGHRYAVVLWLLGMMRWWLPSQRADAVMHWEESIQCFIELARQADQTNLPSRRVWYETQASIMKSVLSQWIVLTKI